MGELHIIIGCMFSGKTTELLRIAKRLKSVEQRVLLINYYEDTRYSELHIKTHDNTHADIKSFFIETLDIDYSEYDVVCINEAQFFTGLKKFCLQAVSDNKIVYVSGLDGDFQQNPFGEILDLIPLCNSVNRLNAFCKICKNGTPAFFTKRLSESLEQKLIGVNEYIPVCRYHIYQN